MASRKTYYKDENISLEFEPYEGDMLIHSEVKHFSPSIYKEALSVFGWFLNDCYSGGYKRVFTVTPNPRYARMFGGKTVNSLTYLGKEYEVVEWDLKQQPLQQ
jgi:hypothetical protein